MSEIERREFLGLLAAMAIVPLPEPTAAGAGSIKPGCAAITWGGKDEDAIREISEVGFKAVQLRATAFDRWSTKPGELKSLLERHGLTFAVMSSGNLKYQPEDRQQQLDLHLSHAAFVRDAGGQILQVIDEKPRNRPVADDDYGRLADMLNTLGERTKAIGVPLVYHHHMNSTGEAPKAIEAIMTEASARAVGLLFDIAHYQQGGGDPVAAIRKYRKAIKVVHLKDVRPITEPPGYQWVELGRGRVDVRGCVAALNETGFTGWAIVELDRVVDPGGTPKASAQTNFTYVVKQLHLTP